jgi:hypothetical protein
MAPNPARRIETHALFPKRFRRKHDLCRDDRILEDFLLVIEIVEKYGNLLRLKILGNGQLRDPDSFSSVEPICDPRSVLTQQFELISAVHVNSHG